MTDSSVPPKTRSRVGSYEWLVASAQAYAPLPTVVVYPVDEPALSAVVEAADAGLIAPTLVGPAGVIREFGESSWIDIESWPVVDVSSEVGAATLAADMACTGQTQAVMKGSSHTSTLLHALLSAEATLKAKPWMSHVFVFDLASYPKALLLSDAVVAVAPNLEQKAAICRNAIRVAHALGIPAPKVAVLSAVEEVDPAITSTIDAAALCKMAERGQISDAVLDGPLAMDNAISSAAAASKRIVSPVAGQADILIAPNLEAGNALYKSLTYFAGADVAGVVVGANVPVMLASRADSVRSRVASAALASIVANSQPRADANAPV